MPLPSPSGQVALSQANFTYSNLFFRVRKRTFIVRRTVRPTALLPRQSNFHAQHTRLTQVKPGSQYDLLVVGGGINGAGIARDAAGRGLSVLLCEQDDLASHTSSASTKLIHGGLRYLENREFGLVRKALQKRETLLRAALHIVRPLRFVMPHMPDLRPAWLIGAGLFLYDHLAKREMLPGSRGISMRSHPAGAPLVDSITRGFVYSDGWVDDARLVVLNALDAAERGATILTRTRLVGAARVGGAWRAQLRRADGSTFDVRAASIANPAGPWVGELLRGAFGSQTDRQANPQTNPPANPETKPAAPPQSAHRVRLVKGSYIVTRRRFDALTRAIDAWFAHEPAREPA